MELPLNTTIGTIFADVFIEKALKQYHYTSMFKKILKMVTQEEDLVVEEKRINKRIKSVNLLSYVSMDKNNTLLEQGMGRSQNISLGGLRMVSHVPIEAQFIQLIAIDNMEELIKFKGMVTYCRGARSKQFHTGIRFIETHERISKIVMGMIKAFNLQKNRFHCSFANRSSEMN